MKAWMIYFREGAEYNKQYINFYKEEGSKLGIEVQLVLVEDLEFGVRDSQWFMQIKKQEVEYPDFVICRAIYPLLSKQLECMGIRVFNNSTVAEICNDKARTYQYLANTGIKMVDSCFYCNTLVREVIEQVHTPTVIKSIEGHGGRQVFLIDMFKHKMGEIDNVTPQLGKEYENSDFQQDNDTKDKQNKEWNDESVRILQGIGSSDVVVQPFISGKHQDLRVYVIGKEIIAAVLRTAKEGFKSNFSLGGEVRIYQLSIEEKQLVNQIINHFDFGLVGIDFILGEEGNLIFNEIEDVVGSRMLYQCAPEINIVERYLKFILHSIEL